MLSKLYACLLKQCCWCWVGFCSAGQCLLSLLRPRMGDKKVSSSCTVGDNVLSFHACLISSSIQSTDRCRWAQTRSDLMCSGAQFYSFPLLCYVVPGETGCFLIKSKVKPNRSPSRWFWEPGFQSRLRHCFTAGFLRKCVFLNAPRQLL